MLNFSLGMLGGIGHSSCWIENFASEVKFLLGYNPGLQGYTHSFPCRLDADFTGITKTATPQIRSLQNYLGYGRDHISNHVKAKVCFLENWWVLDIQYLCSAVAQWPSVHWVRLTGHHCVGTQAPILRASLCFSFRQLQDLNLCLCTAFCTHVLVIP